MRRDMQTKVLDRLEKLAAARDCEVVTASSFSNVLDAYVQRVGDFHSYAKISFHFDPESFSSDMRNGAGLPVVAKRAEYDQEAEINAFFDRLQPLLPAALLHAKAG